MQVSEVYQRLGIGPREQPPSHYRLLGLAPFESRPEAIEGAADQQTARLRGLSETDPAVQQVLREVAAARLTLMQPARKLAYDDTLRGVRPGAPAGGVAGQQSLPDVLAQRPAAPAPPSRKKQLVIAAVAVAALASAAMLLMPQKPPPPQPDGKLHLAWEEPLRRDAELYLNDAKMEIPVTGIPEYLCRPGPVKVVITAPGQNRFEREVTVRPDQTVLVDVPWQGRPAAAVASKTLAKPTKTEPAKLRTVKPAVAKEEPAEGDPAENMAGAGTEKPTAEEENPQVAEKTAKGEPEEEEPEAAPSKEPIAIRKDLTPRLEEAWALIEQKEHKQGYEMLEQLLKQGRDDLRVAFSLGLVDALVAHDWQAAEKHFEICRRVRPDNVPVLHNLALVRFRVGNEPQAVRLVETLAKGEPPKELGQNLRRILSFSNAGQIHLTNPQVKSLDAVASKVAESGGQYKSSVGFLYLPLVDEEGKILMGWKDARMYQDRWCVWCGGRGEVRCTDPDCSKGTVRKVKPRVIMVHPITRQPIVEQFAVRESCKTCKGEGFVDCKHCKNGLDPTLKPSSTYAKPR